MSSLITTRGSTGTFCSDDVVKLGEWIRDAERIVVGAGSGLSTAAGLEYSGPRFTHAFSDFISKYGYRDMYTSSFQQYASPEENWAYWSRHIMLNRYLFEENGTYARLRRVLDGKDYFVITTNVDHLFIRSGFPKDRLFYTQGDYGLWQCSGPCCQETYDNEDAVRRMYEAQRDMKVPSDLVPFCPRCGRPMEMNLRKDGKFVQDAGWYDAAKRYSKFLNGCEGKDTLFLELGVGYNTPGIIKIPFWEMTTDNRKARYACVNMGAADCPPGLKGRALCLDADIAQVLERLESAS